ncbi:MAG: hypothetical protein ACOYOV_12460 [Bacteroidales bacterium]
MEENAKTVKQLINEWFDGARNYAEGLALLEKANPNLRALVKHLRRGESAEKMKHLTYALFKISDHTDARICDSKITGVKLPAKPKKVTGGKKEVKENPGIELGFDKETPEYILLARIIERKKTIYNERALAHKAMTDLGDDNSAEIVSKRIEFLAKIDHCTKIVDYLHAQEIAWKESGVTPDAIILEWIPIAEAPAEEKKDIIVGDIAEVDLQLELQKVRSRLSKYPAKIEKYTGDKLEEIKVKQADDIKLKEELTQKLNAIRTK